MNKFLKALQDAGIEEAILKHIAQKPAITAGEIADLIDYELGKDENLEDAFLQDAHTLAINTVVGHYMKKVIYLNMNR